jgi:hypothetical protein
MLQEIIVWIVFGGAVFYIGAHLLWQKKEKGDCAKGCGGCSSANLDVSDKVKSSGKRHSDK